MVAPSEYKREDEKWITLSFSKKISRKNYQNYEKCRRELAVHRPVLRYMLITIAQIQANLRSPHNFP